MDNPYRWDQVNVDLFYGKDRIALLQAIVDGLAGVGAHGHSYAISGGRRMGKTTLLRRVELELNARAISPNASTKSIIPIYIDGLALTWPMTMGKLWMEITERLWVFFPDMIRDIQVGREYHTFISALKAIVAMAPARFKIVFLFEEMEGVMKSKWSTSFWGNWRSLISNNRDLQEFISIALVGAEEILTLRTGLTSPLSNVVTWRTLRVLSDSDAYLLMQKPMMLDLSEDFLKEAYRQTGGHPMLIQYIMQHVASHPISSALASLDQAAERFLAEQHLQFRDWWGKYCSESARSLYAYLANAESIVPVQHLRTITGGSGLRDALESLEHVGLICAEHGGQSYRCGAEMFRRWYYENEAL